MRINIDPAKIEKWVKANFPDYIRRTGKNGDELVIANPFYGNDSKKFNISLTKAVCHDWRDDSWALPVNPKTGKANKSFIKFVKLYRKCSYDQAIKEVLGSSVDLKNVYRPEAISEPSNLEVLEVQLPSNATALSVADDRIALMVKRYLYSRGYTDDQINMKMLMHKGSDIIWPYFEYEELVYWQSRSILNKRFNFPDSQVFDGDRLKGKLEVGKSDFLYGFDEVKYGSYAIITEAIFDQNTIGDQALASGGATLSKTQIKKLKLLGVTKVILAADADNAGIKSIISNAKDLTASGFKVYYSVCPLESGAKDWNEQFTVNKLSLPDIRKLFDKCIAPYNIMNMSKLVEKVKKLKDDAKRLS